MPQGCPVISSGSSGRLSGQVRAAGLVLQSSPTPRLVKFHIIPGANLSVPIACSSGRYWRRQASLLDFVATRPSLCVAARPLFDASDTG